LKSIVQDGSIQVIRMSASSDGQTITKDYLEEMQQEAEEKSIAIVFGKLMCDLGQYDKSQKYFEHMLNESNDEDPAWIEFNIGRPLYGKGEWNTAREYYDRAYNRLVNAKPARIKDSAYVLKDIGTILSKQGKYDEALDCHQRALEIQVKYDSSGYIDIASILNNIGLALHHQRKYDEPLEYHQQALKL